MDTRVHAQADAASGPSGSGPCVLLSTGSLFHLPLPRIAELGKAAGFAGLDLVMGGPKIRPGRAVEEAHSLCPVRVVHAPFRNWSAWGGHLDAWRAAAALAASVLPADGGGVHVTLHPPSGTLSDAIQTRWFSRAEDLPRLLGARPGVDFSLENLPWAGGALFGKDELAALLKECEAKGLGLTLDVCHLGVSGRDVLADLERIPAGLVRHVHCSDASGFREHLPPGEGELPVGPFLARLGRMGYAGTVSLELDPAHLPDVGSDVGPDSGAEDGPDAEGRLVAVLSGLRQGMLAALGGCPPAAWAGGLRAGAPRQSSACAAFG